MDQRELDTTIKALQKAVGENLPAKDVITILETLKKDVVPTEELLRVRFLFKLHIPLPFVSASSCPYAALVIQ